MHESGSIAYKTELFRAVRSQTVIDLLCHLSVQFCRLESSITTFLAVFEICLQVIHGKTYVSDLLNVDVQENFLVRSLSKVTMASYLKSPSEYSVSTRTGSTTVHWQGDLRSEMDRSWTALTEFVPDRKSVV